MAIDVILKERSRYIYVLLERFLTAYNTLLCYFYREFQRDYYRLSKELLSMKRRRYGTRFLML